MFLHLHICLQD